MIQKSMQLVSLARVLQTVLVSIMLVSFTVNAEQTTEPKKTASVAFSEQAKAGKKVAFSRKKGNCLACHLIQGGEATGNIGPPLILMKGRFPDKSKLRMQIWDSTKSNPESSMPPFGRHSIISEKEIDQLTDYVWTL